MPGAAGSGDLAERDGSAADNQPEEEEASDGSLDDEELEEGLIFGPSDDDGPEEDDGTYVPSAPRAPAGRGAPARGRGAQWPPTG